MLTACETPFGYQYTYAFQVLVMIGVKGYYRMEPPLLIIFIQLWLNTRPSISVDMYMTFAPLTLDGMLGKSKIIQECY